MMSVHRYRQSLIEEAIPSKHIETLVKRHAKARVKYKNKLMKEPSKKAKRKIKKQLIKKYGRADKLLVNLILKSKKKNKRTFNPFTDDPNCKSCGKKYNNLLNKHLGQTCYIVGKGPSVDKWIDEGSHVEKEAFTMGINSIGDYIKFDYLVTSHPEFINPISEPHVLFSTKESERKVFEKKGWQYFPHTDDPSREMQRLNLTKDQLNRTGEFYAASSTTQNAIHLAWFMGFADIVLIGIDGGNKYSKVIKNQKPDTSKKYNLMKKDTENVLNRLFPDRWRYLHKPIA